MMIILNINFKGLIMFKNFFKITFRNILRNKTYSFINIAGLSIGIACFIIIFLFINNELSYDNFHKEGERIYRVLRASSNANENYRIGVTSAPFSTALQNDFPNEIEEVLRVMPGEALVTYNDKSFFEKNF
ncbi:MAG: ABC transporter permease, partial [Ignavibacteriales bacterium]